MPALRVLMLGLPLCAASVNWFQELRLIAPEHRGIVFTQLPRNATNFGEGGRIVALGEDQQLRVLTQGFHSAADPEVSFDAQSILFAGKRSPSDPWQIYEMRADGSEPRAITSGPESARHPIYQSKFYNISFDQPWRQITFRRGSDLYSAKLDGSLLRRLTFNRAENFEPLLMPDGRLVFPARLGRRSALFGINLDGTDYAIYSGYEGTGTKRAPAVTDAGLAVFVEAAIGAWDGAGTLASVSIRRSLRSYARIPGAKDALYAWPSAIPGGEVLVSVRTTATPHAIVRLDPRTGRAAPVFSDPAWHNFQAKLLAPRPEADGRASVVEEQQETGTLYCLDVKTSDQPALAARGRRVRLIDGSAEWPRILGETALAEDGSFFAEVPANTPFKVQLLDGDGLALRTSEWMWVKNRENRGCIGCHEDGELVPENRLAGATTRPPVQMTQPPDQRRTVEYARHVAPVLAKCANGTCHANGFARHIKAGNARASRLVAFPKGKAVPAKHPRLSDAERRTIAEWIDLGAQSGKEVKDETRTATRR